MRNVFIVGLSCSSDGKESACNAGDTGSVPGCGKIPWRRKWPLTPAFLSGSAAVKRPGQNHKRRVNSETWAECFQTVSWLSVAAFWPTVLRSRLTPNRWAGAPPPPCSVIPPLGASSLWTRTEESRPAFWGGCGVALPGGLRCPSCAPGVPLHPAHGDNQAGPRLLLPPCWEAGKPSG